MTAGAHPLPEAPGSLEGHVITDPRTGMHAVMERADERGGTGFDVVYELAPGGGPYVFPEHWHRDWDERFEILEGIARYKLAGREAVIAAGETVAFPAGVPHLHPWNAGPGPMRFRQKVAVRAPDPATMRDTIHAVNMYFWLSRQGRVNARGMPPLVEAAPFAERLLKGGIYMPHVPVALQVWATRALAAWARRKGYVAFDPACLR